MPTWVPIILTILLSTGGIAFVSMLGRGILAVRSGASAREKETINNIKQMHSEQVAELRKEAADRRFRQDLPARYHWQLVSSGYEPDPREPIPPSQRPRRPGQHKG